MNLQALRVACSISLDYANYLYLIPEYVGQPTARLHLPPSWPVPNAPEFCRDVPGSGQTTERLYGTLSQFDEETLKLLGRHIRRYERKWYGGARWIIFLQQV